MKRALIATVAFTMLATIAAANEGHGGGQASNSGFSFGFDGEHGGAADTIVGSDGTLYVESTTVTSGVATTKVTAIRPSGAVAWTATVSGREHLILSGTNLISVTETKATDGTFTSTLSAISATTGAAAWTRTLSGRVVELEPFSGGTYAIVITPATTSGAAATRSVVGIGNDGSVLFTTAIP
jgi:outer membrane protein assembly factor BamB